MASTVGGQANAQPIYALESSLEDKIKTIAQKIYGATDVEYNDVAKEKLARLARLGYGGLPICMAKTQYSFSDNPALMGVPTGWNMKVTDILLSAGAGFVVVVSGAMMLMPGLGKVQRGFDIDVDADGNITGLA